MVDYPDGVSVEDLTGDPREEAQVNPAQGSFVRELVDFVRGWRHCENRACRRGRTCTDARACKTKHADAILEWLRRVYVPLLSRTLSDRVVGRAGFPLARE